MQIAAAHWMISESDGLALPRLARAGCEAIALSGEPDRVGDWGELAARLDEHRLRVWSVLAMMEDDGRDLAASDAVVRKSACVYLKRTVDLAARLGGGVVTFTPAPLGRLEPAAAARTEWGRYVEGLRAVADHAAERSVVLALEPLIRFETYLLNRAEQALALLEDIDAENVGLCLDTFHMHVEERSASDAIRLTGDRLFDLHIADSNRGAPGDGSIDWASIMSAVADVGYSGHWTLEIDPPRDSARTGDGWRSASRSDACEECLRRAVARLRALAPT